MPARVNSAQEAPSDAFQLQTIASLPPMVEVASATSYSCARPMEGNVWCWGDNALAQLGGTAHQPGPFEVTTAERAVAIQLAGNRACARLDNGH
jgi:hypothetical protein